MADTLSVATAARSGRARADWNSPEHPAASGGKGPRSSADLAAAPGAERSGPEGERTFVLAVENMHCGGCMRKVEAALLATAGVIAARTNLSQKRVTVIARDAVLTQAHGDRSAPVEVLVAAIGQAGFRAAQVTGEVEDAGHRTERDLLMRLAVAGFAAANVMLLSVAVWSGQASGDMDPALKSLLHWVTALIALPTIAYSGQPFFRSAVASLRMWRLNMDVPISLGVLLATGLSIYQTAFGDGHVYFDAAVMLLFFLLIGRFLDMRMRTRAAGAATNILALRAMSADVVGDDGIVRRLPAHALQPGMVVQVLPGERIAVDGEIDEGSSDVDASLITGESTPVAVTPGAQVFAGAINLSGRIRVRAKAVEDGTLLSEIGRLMAVAEQGRGQYVRMADRAAKAYAPAVHILGLATLIGWLVAGYGIEPALTAAIAVLIITCPCALALAVPAVQVAASGRLFAGGILVKSADGLERLAEVDTVVFDKTGTLTTGVPILINSNDISDECLAAAAALASNSKHPYSRALVAAASQRGLTVACASDVREVPGAGLVQSLADGRDARLGSVEFCGLEERDDDAATLWWRPVEGVPVPFRFEDAVKSDAGNVIRELQRAGYHVEIVSGDRQRAVAAAVAAMGVDVAWAARCTPAEKVNRIAALAAGGRKVLMVGDGLNDAPALASGHASLSPTEAAEISQTSADAVFQGQALAPVLETLRVAQACERLAVQNFIISLAYNVVFVPIAVIGYVTPLLAAIAMSASSIAVTANAVRLSGKRLSLQKR
ncbi:MAG: heavy metal translocating P-type ATPase [Hyphomicrobiaceae bacterium]